MWLAQLVAAGSLVTTSAISFNLESYSYVINQDTCACDQCYAELRRPNEEAGQSPLKCGWRGKLAVSSSMIVSFLEEFVYAVSHAGSCTVPEELVLNQRILGLTQ